ncbi:hypothetical protein [Cerasicoccus arenae]|uniref:Uncharacterized protein n=1 Tax=Cerasicoccus arenae TaxID=424488 RepID=A0A8J3DGP0_9BACT|nr:hypothetical protein [Cerasicoccus arenae]MBK1858156.1 hypothetical protein [Cerasicoccus arenae]GHB96828.1 hypothetical protein GCM10007047_10980 [Cerasicoccus arenae]
MTTCVASTLDWDALSWTPGSTSQTYNNVDGSGVNVTISISGGSFLTNYPQLNTDTTGGVSPAQKSLQLYINESSQGNGATVTISFSSAVNSLTLNLYDVDTGSGGFFSRTFRDQVNFNQTPSSLTGSSANGVFGDTVLGLYENDSTSSGGNVTAVYNGPVSSVSFFYGAGIWTQSNPAGQAISLADFTFTSPIPEPSTYLFGGLLMGFVGLHIWRSLKSQKEASHNADDGGKSTPSRYAASAL